MTLRRVLEALAKKQTSMAPYRESLLTRMFEDFFRKEKPGKTSLIMCIKNSAAEYPISLGTLEFGALASEVEKIAPPAERDSAKQEVKELRAQLLAAREQLLETETRQEELETEIRQEVFDDMTETFKEMEKQLRETYERQLLLQEAKFDSKLALFQQVRGSHGDDEERHQLRETAQHLEEQLHLAQEQIMERNQAEVDALAKAERLSKEIAEYERQSEALHSKLKELGSENAEIQSLVKAARQENDELKENLRSVHKEMTAAAKASKADFTALEQKFKKLEREQKTTSTKMEKEKQKILAQSAAKEAGESEAKDQIARLEAQIALQLKKEEEQEAELDRLQAQLDEAAAGKAEAEGELASQAAELKKVQAEVKERRDTVEKLTAQNKNLRILIEEGEVEKKELNQEVKSLYLELKKGRTDHAREIEELVAQQLELEEQLSERDERSMAQGQNEAELNRLTERIHTLEAELSSEKKRLMNYEKSRMEEQEEQQRQQGHRDMELLSLRFALEKAQKAHADKEASTQSLQLWNRQLNSRVEELKNEVRVLQKEAEARLDPVGINESFNLDSIFDSPVKKPVLAPAARLKEALAHTQFLIAELSRPQQLQVSTPAPVATPKMSAADRAPSLPDFSLSEEEPAADPSVYPEPAEPAPAPAPVAAAPASAPPATKPTPNISARKRVLQKGTTPIAFLSGKFSQKKKESSSRIRPPSPKPEVLSRVAGRLPTRGRHVPTAKLEMEASEAIAEMEHQANARQASGDENQDNSPGKRKQTAAAPASKRQRVPLKAAAAEPDARPRRTTARYGN